MPIVDDDGGGSGLTEASGTALERIKNSNPKLFSECDIRLSEFINYNLGSTRQNIKCFQFNKIRMILSAIKKKHGYPAVQHHTVAFFDLLMFSIPFYTRLNVIDTISLWDHGFIFPEQAWSTKFTSVNPIYEWRQVLIFDIPNDYLAAILTMLPFQVDDVAIKNAMKLTTRVWDIFSNLLDYSGLNDKIIVCNWDKILEVLNENGY